MRYHNLTPHQQELAQRTMEEIFDAANQIPEPPKPRCVEDMRPLVQKLRDEKRMPFTDISDWMRNNTEFYRSASFWSQLYKGKIMKITSIESKVEQEPKVTDPHDFQGTDIQHCTICGYHEDDDIHG